MKREKNLIYLKDELKNKRKMLEDVWAKMDEYTRKYDRLLWEVDVLEKKVKLEQEHLKLLNLMKYDLHE